MPILKKQRRLYAARKVAFYSPSALRSPGAITHVAAVTTFEIVNRSAIQTPWASRYEGDPQCILYHLGKVTPLVRPIVNRDRDNHGQRVSGHRWTSRLGLERATTLNELLLETEPEWRLYEDLTVADVTFDLEPLPPRLLDPADPVGRTWFVVKKANMSIRYTGDSGFRVRALGSANQYYAKPKDVISRILSSNTHAG